MGQGWEGSSLEQNRPQSQALELRPAPTGSLLSLPGRLGSPQSGLQLQFSPALCIPPLGPARVQRARTSDQPREVCCGSAGLRQMKAKVTESPTPCSEYVSPAPSWASWAVLLKTPGPQPRLLEAESLKGRNLILKRLYRVLTPTLEPCFSPACTSASCGSRNSTRARASTPDKGNQLPCWASGINIFRKMIKMCNRG